MGYLHINNLYKDNTIQLFKECYALEKVHGTSAHISWRHRGDGPPALHLASGGAKASSFRALFNEPLLTSAFEALGHNHVTVYGEAYGGSMQKMSAVYGKELAFIAFDVAIQDTWLDVQAAAAFCAKIGIEFVPYELTSTHTEALDLQRDKPSVVAERRGCSGPREGVVLRPLVEMELQSSDGARYRVISKHRHQDYEERANPPKVGASTQVLADADAIALEWVTPRRLEHVLASLHSRMVEDGAHSLAEHKWTVQDLPVVLEFMREDVLREAKGEIVVSKAALSAINKRCALMFKFAGEV